MLNKLKLLSIVAVTLVAAIFIFQKSYQKNKEDSVIIPRQILFGNPDKASVKLSPDGNYISYIAPHEGVLNIFVAPYGNLEQARLVTDDKKRGIRSYFWTYDNKHVVYMQDTDGDENWHAYSVDVTTGKQLDLTPFKGVRAQITELSRKFPDKIIVGLNKRIPEFFDLYEIDVNTGQLKLIYENNLYGDFILDHDLNLRFASRMTKDGGLIVDMIGSEGVASQFMEIGADDIYTTNIIGFNDKNDKIYMTDSVNSNTASFSILDLASMKKDQIYINDKADVSGIIMHPSTYEPQIVYYEYDKVAYQVLDKAIQSDMDYLRKQDIGDISLASRTTDDKLWIVAYSSDISPTKYYIYDKEKQNLEFLFSNRKDLEGQKLLPMYPVITKTRDNLELVNYLTLPASSNNGIISDNRDFKNVKIQQKVPLLLLVHGGPTARDNWGLNAMHQWLANRGYAVLSVNYRGSTGFGKEFIKKGNGEWSLKMHDDLIDSVNWAIFEGITSKEKVAIMGGSYGGYAALVGLTFTPEFFACGVDIVGPSNLSTLLDSIPPYWKPHVEALCVKLGGNNDSEEGKENLKKRSPLTYVNNIKRPLLIGQGANDPRVKQAESEQIVKAMNEKHIPVTYVLYPDEGHGFARPENRLSFYAITEYFLSTNLGGLVEKVGDDFNGSSYQVKEGRDLLTQMQK